MAQSAFAKAFVKKAQKVFTGAKGHKHRTGRSFGNADVPDGNFTAVVTAETGVVKKGKNEGNPYVSFKATINQGPYEGQEPSKLLLCKGEPISTDKDAFPTAEQQLIGLLGFLLPDIEIEDIDQVEAAIDEINRRGPVCLINVRNRKVEDKTYQDVFFNKVVKDQSFASNESPEVADDSDGGEADAETPETDPPFDFEPTKGDMVTVDGDGEWEVLQVSKSRKTVNVVDTDGTKKNGVAWDSLELI